MFIQIIFFSSIAFIIYAYFGYPFLLMTLSFFMSRNIRKQEIDPPVSFIIAAYNEEAGIRHKIENTLQQDYHRDRMEIIVASDCSTDETDRITRSYRRQGVRLIRATERKGKENAQKHAIASASGDVLIFSDVATLLDRDGVSTIVKNFSDPTVGCVSSVDRFIDSDGVVRGESAYVKYEMMLRNLETKINGVVGLSGSFFAARREVCKNWSADLPGDFHVLIQTVKKGLRGVSDDASVGYYKNIKDEKKEFERKVRTVLRGISVLMRNPDFLNPFRYGIFSWQLISHKLCRWLVPFALITLFCSNVALLAHRTAVYAWFMSLQVLFYAVGLAGIRSRFPSLPFKLSSFFILVNASILVAWLKYAQGERMVRWEPSTR